MSAARERITLKKAANLPRGHVWTNDDYARAGIKPPFTELEPGSLPQPTVDWAESAKTRPVVTNMRERAEPVLQQDANAEMRLSDEAVAVGGRLELQASGGRGSGESQQSLLGIENGEGDDAEQHGEQEQFEVDATTSNPTGAASPPCGAPSDAQNSESLRATCQNTDAAQYADISIVASPAVPVAPPLEHSSREVASDPLTEPHANAVEDEDGRTADGIKLERLRVLVQELCEASMEPLREMMSPARYTRRLGELCQLIVSKEVRTAGFARSSYDSLSDKQQERMLDFVRTWTKKLASSLGCQDTPSSSSIVTTVTATDLEGTSEPSHVPKAVPQGKASALDQEGPTRISSATDATSLQSAVPRIGLDLPSTSLPVDPLRDARGRTTDSAPLVDPHRQSADKLPCGRDTRAIAGADFTTLHTEDLRRAMERLERLATSDRQAVIPDGPVYQGRIARECRLEPVERKSGRTDFLLTAFWADLPQSSWGIRERSLRRIVAECAGEEILPLIINVYVTRWESPSIDARTPVNIRLDFAPPRFTMCLARLHLRKERINDVRRAWMAQNVALLAEHDIAIYTGPLYPVTREGAEDRLRQAVNDKVIYTDVPLLPRPMSFLRASEVEARIVVAQYVSPRFLSSIYLVDILATERVDGSGLSFDLMVKTHSIESANALKRRRLLLGAHRSSNTEHVRLVSAGAAREVLTGTFSPVHAVGVEMPQVVPDEPQLLYLRVSDATVYRDRFESFIHDFVYTPERIASSHARMLEAGSRALTEQLDPRAMPPTSIDVVRDYLAPTVVQYLGALLGLPRSTEADSVWSPPQLYEGLAACWALAFVDFAGIESAPVYELASRASEVITTTSLRSLLAGKAPSLIGAFDTEDISADASTLLDRLIEAQIAPTDWLAAALTMFAVRLIGAVSSSAHVLDLLSRRRNDSRCLAVRHLAQQGQQAELRLHILEHLRMHPSTVGLAYRADSDAILRTAGAFQEGQHVWIDFTAVLQFDHYYALDSHRDEYDLYDRLCHRFFGDGYSLNLALTCALVQAIYAKGIPTRRNWDSDLGAVLSASGTRQTYSVDGRPPTVYPVSMPLLLHM
ncbi:hypothetical protein JCM10908_000436 [Rhodotorula pacifica]|uniref:uncharacterized protein n=1 Tax=Rhodotorula pacifica TaxID=1495444 RepID=UPI00316F97EF